MSNASGPATVALTVPDISCGHCKRAIEGALQGVAGIDDAVVDVESRTVRMRLSTSGALPAAVAAIEDAGYEVPDPSGAPPA